MIELRSIDVHTHVLTEETAALLRKVAPAVPVSITPIDDATYALDVGDTTYRPFPRGGFDLAQRLSDMDAAGVDVHVLSATPQTYMYNQEVALGVATAVIQNDQMAKHIAANPTRFMGIATLPMQAPEKAADELKRAVTKLGLQGAMFQYNIIGKISTIRASSRCGRRRRRPAPSSSSTPITLPAPTACGPITSTT